MRFKRDIQIGETVKVYRNLHTGKISVLGKTRVGWRVIQHVDAITLLSANFLVNERGRQEVLRTKQKGVHAFVVGVVGAPPKNLTTCHVTYNPYKYSSFVYKHSEKPIMTAPRVFVEATGRMTIA